MSRRLNTQTGSTPTALPAYEPPILPLTKTALDTLSTKIPKTHDGIETHIAYALRALTASASELGSLTHSKGPEDATKPQREQKLAELEAAARTVLDAAARLEASKGVVKQLARDEIQRADETEENRVQARGAAEEEDEDADPEGGDDYRPVAVQEGVWGRYKSLCESQAEEYMAKSEKEKYADNEGYADFRRTLWDAQNPDVPMPPARTWFKTPGAPEEAEDSSDDDIEIAQEHISYNCPLTLVQFVNPVKSAVCSHHFEKEAIYQLIGRGPSVDCPVGGCNQIITKADLVEDHYMIQKIQRHEQALVRQRRRDEREEGEEGGRREEEEEEEEEGVSETPISTEDLARIKKEKGAAARPKARRRGARPTIMELEDSDMEE